MLIIYAIQVNVYFGPNTTTTIVEGNYAAYTAGVVCVFNEIVSNRLYTVKRLVTMNNELETEWVTGMYHRRPGSVTSYSDVIWLCRTRAFELVSIKQQLEQTYICFYDRVRVLLLRFG